jgi:hypothetical protein
MILEITMWKKERKIERITLRSEQGAVLVVALLMLVILSIMGAFAMTISMIEQRVTLNSEVFQHNLYTVEATTLEAAARIDDGDDTDLLNAGSPPFGWIIPQNPNALIVDLSQSGNWPHPSYPLNETNLPAPMDLKPQGYNFTNTVADDKIMYGATDRLTSAGEPNCPAGSAGSVTYGSPQEHCYDVYGIYDIKRGNGKAYSGRMMMKIGYKKVLYP